MSKKFGSLIVVLVFVFSLSATARAETFYAYLNSAQEVPTNASTATGYARVVLNETAGTISFTVVFNGLSSTQTASHIHAPGAIGVSVGVVINFGAVGGTSGTITGTASITPTQITQLRQHLGYVNIHSMNFSGGEIRGQLGNKRPVDFDGDGRTDFSVLRFPNVAPPGVAPIDYYNLNSTSGFQAVAFGNANTDFPAPGDYDGDSLDDFALFRGGANPGDQSAFFILQTSTNTLQYYAWGVRGDQAVARDYDGDGKTDVAVFRRGAAAGDEAFWYILQSSTLTARIVQWGTTGGVGSGDTPVPGDYDGDGKFDYVAVRTGATANAPMNWYILQSSNNQLRAQQFGLSSDVPTQGDYDGDARTDIAIYRRGASATANSTFWVYESLSNTTRPTTWGLSGDFPVASFDAR